LKSIIIWDMTPWCTRRHIPEDDTLHNHRCENLKFYRPIFVSYIPFRGISAVCTHIQYMQMLQRTCYSASGKRRTTGGIHTEIRLIVNCFAPNNSSTCAKNLFQLINKILQTAPTYLFSFLSYRCLKSRHSFR
jgi:hypothetical protein